MKMTKILLTAALLVSARAFASQEVAQTVAPAAQAAAEVVKTGLFARMRASAGQLWTNGIAKTTTGAKYVWGKVPGMRDNVKTKLASCWTWTTGKGATVSNWVVNHTPPAVKNAITSKRNLKIAGAATALATVATCWYFFGNRLMPKKAKTN